MLLCRIVKCVHQKFKSMGEVAGLNRFSNYKYHINFKRLIETFADVEPTLAAKFPHSIRNIKNCMQRLVVAVVFFSFTKIMQIIRATALPIRHVQYDVLINKNEGNKCVIENFSHLNSIE